MQQKQFNSKNSSQIHQYTNSIQTLNTNSEKPAILSRNAKCWPRDYNNYAFKPILSSPSSLPIIPEVEEDTVPEDKIASSTGYNPFSFISSLSSRNGTALEPIIEEDEECTEKNTVHDEKPLNCGQGELDNGFEYLTSSIK